MQRIVLSRGLCGVAVIILAACQSSRPPVSDIDTAGPLSLVYLSGGPDIVDFRKVQAPSLLDGTMPVVEVDLRSPRQTVEAFSGAFNEKGWEAMKVLSSPEREELLKNIFASDTGLSLSMGRIPVGSSDYALSRYTDDEVPGDFEMRGFSIDRDRQALIPYIHAAQKYNPQLKFWASAWTPPTWMKTNKDFDHGAMLNDAKVYQAYALYLTKFVQAYGTESIPIGHVAVQNEPMVDNNYPGCFWAPAQYRTFIRDFLGPAFANLPGTEVMLGTLNDPRNEAHADAVLRDPEAKKYVQVMSFQWDWLPFGKRVLASYPDVRIWETETDCGNHFWESSFNREYPESNFAYGAKTWRKMREFFTNGAVVYSLWNIVLDEHGKSIDSKVPWPQNAPVVVDQGQKTVVYTPMFYAFAAYSRFVVPGSRVLSSTGNDSIAFLRPDGSVVVELLNADSSPMHVTVRAGAATAVIDIPATRFATAILTP